MTSPIKLGGVHHAAYRCKDAKETVEWYEAMLGMTYTTAFAEDHVPSTGEYCPYVHIFFEMTDGSYVAFFDLGDDTAAEPSPNTPAWVNHIALRVDSVADLQAMRERLEAHGVDVLGITDHHIIRSIYFFDPNGLRVELTTPTVDDAVMAGHAREAHALLRAWSAEQQARRQESAREAE